MTEYALGIDMWSIGCIFLELVNKTPLWRGDSAIDQLYRIFRTLGTPDETLWPGVTKLPEFKSSFPKWRRKGLDSVTGRLDVHGVDLVQVCDSFLR
jgi:serine/threonine protein kinase